MLIGDYLISDHEAIAPLFSDLFDIVQTPQELTNLPDRRIGL